MAKFHAYSKTLLCLCLLFRFEPGQTNPLMIRVLDKNLENSIKSGNDIAGWKDRRHLSLRSGESKCHVREKEYNIGDTIENEDPCLDCFCALVGI